MAQNVPVRPKENDPEISTVIKKLIERSSELDKATIDLLGRLVTIMPDTSQDFETDETARSYLSPIGDNLGLVLNNIDLAIGVIRKISEENQL